MNNDLPAVLSNDSPAFREAKAEPATRFAAAEKGLEDMAAKFVRNSRAIVADNYLSHMPFANKAFLNGNVDYSAVARRLDCVFHYGVNSHAKLRLVGHYLQVPFLGGKRNLSSVFSCAAAKFVYDLSHEVSSSQLRFA